MRQKIIIVVLLLASIWVSESSAQGFPTDGIEQLLNNLGLGGVVKNITSGKGVDWIKVINNPLIFSTLTSNGVEPKLVIDVIAHINMKELLISMKASKMIQLLFKGNMSGITKVVESWNYDEILGTIDVKKVVQVLIGDEKISSMIKKYGIDPKMISAVMESIDMNVFVKAINIEQLINGAINGKVPDVATVLDNLNFAKIMASLDIPKVINILFQYRNISDLLTKFGLSAKMLEALVTSMDVKELVKAVDVKKIIKYLLSGKTDDIMKMVMESVNFSKLLQTFDVKKVVINMVTRDAMRTLPTLSQPCYAQLIEIVAPFKNISLQDNLPMLMTSFAAKYIDSWAKPPPRVLLGNIRWLGAYEECNDIPGAHYCMSYMSLFGQHNPLVPGIYGNCVPKQCTTDDVLKILKVAENMTSKYISFSQPACEEPREYKTGFILTLVLCVILCVLCGIGTSLELLRTAENEVTDEKPVANGNATQMHDFKEEENEFKYMEAATVTSVKNEHFLIRFFKCFGLLRNTRTVLSVDVPKGAIGSINGIRTLSMMWVILGHLYYFGFLSPLDNPLTVEKLFHTYKFLPVSNAYVSVDSFFLLSGLLVACLGFRRMDKNNGSLNVPMFYLHRFIRLTPPYMFVILFWNNIFPLIITGPLSQMIRRDKFQKECNSYWWTNLLYINNLYPKNEMCLGWSWYLANDMQFYLISPVFLYAIYYFDRRYQNSRYRHLGGYVIIVSACLIFCIIAAVVIGVNDYPVLTTATIFHGNPRSSKAQGMFSDVYIKPWIRIPPYLVGMFLGYILSRQVLIRSRFKKVIYFFGWIISTLIVYGVIFGTWGVFKKGGSFLTSAQAASYGSLHRFAFGISVAWVIYACHNKAAGYINNFLSWRIWIPLSRLTFGAYLLHPLVLMYFFYAQENSYHYSQNLVIFDFISLTSTSYICAFVLAIFVEYPVMNLEKMTFKN